MRVTYKREMKHNYMIVEPENDGYKRYEEQMMENNHISGLLRFRVKQTESSLFYYYEITSRQPISRILENRCITLEEIHRLLLDISSVLNRMSVYLLKEEQIILEPDYVYVEPASFEAGLCLIPGRSSSFPDAFSRLLQYLMGKVNHQDKDCVVLVYGLYQESLKENYGMENLLQYLVMDHGTMQKDKQRIDVQPNRTRENSNMEHKTENPSMEPSEKELQGSLWEWQEGKPDGTKKISPVQPVSIARKKWLLFIPVILAEPVLLWFLLGVDGIVRYGLWLALFNIVFIVLLFLWLRGENKEKQEGNKEETWQMHFEQEEIPSYASEHSSIKPPVETFQRPKAGNNEFEKVANTEDGNTTLLVDLRQAQSQRILVSLDKSVPNIPIPYFPFIIGKQEDLVDYILSQGPVSRLHLKIDREGDCYQVTDLNSTNGTKLRGMLLEANETANLEIGDEIYMANIGFQFT